MRGSRACRVIQAEPSAGRIWPLWNGTGASVQVTRPQARSISSGRSCTSSAPMWASSSRPGWRFGRTTTTTPPAGERTSENGSRGQGE